MLTVNKYEQVFKSKKLTKEKKKEKIMATIKAYTGDLLNRQTQESVKILKIFS